MKIWKTLLCFIAVCGVVWTASQSAAQETVPKGAPGGNPDDKNAAQGARISAKLNQVDQEVTDYDFADGALLDGVAELSGTPNLQMHLGVEEILRARLATPRDRTVRFALHLEHKKVRDILDALCQNDPRYTWAADGSTINIYPKAHTTDSSYFLNFMIERIRLTNVPDPDQALTPLSELFPGVVGYMQTGGDNTYEAPWTVTFGHLTVRQFANRIAEHAGSQTSWVWQGGKDAQVFTFVRGGFHTR